MKCFLVCLLVACDAGVPGPQPATPSTPQPAWPPPAPAASPEPTSLVTVDGRSYTIVRLRSYCGEATNLGGEHWDFEVDGMPEGYALHGGGHGIYGDDTTLPSGVIADEIWNGRYYVAEVTLMRAPAEVGGSTCTHHREYNGRVQAVVAANDLDDARRRLAAIPRDGFHPALRIDHMNAGDRRKLLQLDLDAAHGR